MPANFVNKEDGYGLGKEALRALHDQGVTLVITVDCGITGVEEARWAREIGLDLVLSIWRISLGIPLSPGLCAGQFRKQSIL